jgi:hypothetical protein
MASKIESKERPYKTREEYQKFMEQVLDQWGSRLDDLNSRVERGSAERNVGYLKELDGLRTKRQEILMRFDEFKASSEDWENLAKELDVSVDKLKADFERAESAIR